MILTSDELGKKLGSLVKVLILGHVILDDFLSSLVTEEVLLRLHFSVQTDSNMNMRMIHCIFVGKDNRQAPINVNSDASPSGRKSAAHRTKQLVAEFVVVAILRQHATSDTLTCCLCE